MNVPTPPFVPIVCVAVAYFLVYLPHFLAGRARFKLAGGFDNRHPRDQTAKLEGWARRAAAAHQNGFESFSPFAIGVVLAWVGQAPARTLSALALAFVVLRAVYIATYIADVDKVRSVVWTGGLLVTFALYLMPLFA